MAAFVGRIRRLVTFFNYVLAIVIYTIVIVYIIRCHDGQNPKESLASFKSGARREDGTVNSALCDERQHPSDRPLSISNSSHNSRDKYDEDENDIETERTNKEFIRKPTDAVTNDQLRSKGTTPKAIRLLCWLLTDPQILDRAKDARDTWMKDCDVRLFMSSKENKTFPAIGLNVSEGRDHIAEKSKAAWTYIYRNHYNDADFFVKADPDSYIVVENLKRYLVNCNPDEPAIYGHNLFFNYTVYNYSSVHYVAGEAVVLGRESLSRLVTKGMLHRECFYPGQAEDMKTCACLANVGGYTVDTRDENGRETFLPPFRIEDITLGKLPNWYTDRYRQPYGYCQSIDCLSRYPVAFHYIKPQEFYLMNYIFRNLRLLSSVSDDDPQFRFNGTRYFSQKSSDKVI